MHSHIPPYLLAQTPLFSAILDTRASGSAMTLFVSSDIGHYMLATIYWHSSLMTHNWSLLTT